MEINQEVLSGVLSGSLATLILKGIIDAVTSRVEHKRALGKELFIRKLNAAEKTTAFYTVYLSKSAEMRMGYRAFIELLRDDSIERNGDVIEEILSKASKTAEELATARAIEISVANLYFDLSNAKDWSDHDYGKLIDLISSIHFLSSTSSDLLKKLQGHVSRGEQQRAVKCNEELDKISSRMAEDLSRIVALLDKECVAIERALKVLKSQLEL
jgi:hypothetical protein